MTCPADTTPPPGQGHAPGPGPSPPGAGHCPAADPGAGRSPGAGLGAGIILVQLQYVTLVLQLIAS